MILNFINRLVSIFKYIIEDKNNKLENMYKKLMISIIILFQFLMRL